MDTNGEHLSEKNTPERIQARKATGFIDPARGLNDLSALPRSIEDTGTVRRGARCPTHLPYVLDLGLEHAQTVKALLVHHLLLVDCAPVPNKNSV